MDGTAMTAFLVAGARPGSNPTRTAGRRGASLAFCLGTACTVPMGRFAPRVQTVRGQRIKPAALRARKDTQGQAAHAAFVKMVSSPRHRKLAVFSVRPATLESVGCAPLALTDRNQTRASCFVQHAVQALLVPREPAAPAVPASSQIPTARRASDVRPLAIQPTRRLARHASLAPWDGKRTVSVMAFRLSACATSARTQRFSGRSATVPMAPPVSTAMMASNQMPCTRPASPARAIMPGLKAYARCALLERSQLKTRRIASFAPKAGLARAANVHLAQAAPKQTR